MARWASPGPREPTDQSAWGERVVVVPVGATATRVRIVRPTSDPRGKPPGRPGLKPPRLRPRAVLAAVGVVAVILLAVLVAAVWPYTMRPLPPVDQVFAADMFQTAMIYDRKGHLLSELVDPNGGKRSSVPLSQVPPQLIDATVMTEDPTFYENPGVDLRAILRALVQDLTQGQVVSGASTITQQLVRNVVMTPEERRSQTLSRKLGEAILALRVSAHYQKDEILQRYLNEIYYGNLAYGVEAASETYFAKPVGQLDLAQAALIAGLPQAPALYDPYAHPDRAKARQREVLDLMVKHGAITQDQADQAVAEPLHYHDAAPAAEAPHFVRYVDDQLADKFSRQEIYDRGLRIATSLDLDLQRQVEGIVRDHLSTLRANGASDVAVIALDPRTGQILAYVGSASYQDDAIHGQVDLASAPRTAGAMLEPFVYLEALDQHLITPASLLEDAPVTYSLGSGQPAWAPRDDDGQFRGPVPARRALATSLAVPTVRLLDRLGVDANLGLLRRLGLATLDQPARYYGLSLALGSGPVRLLDLTDAYAALADGGVRAGSPGPTAILRVTDATGKVVEDDSAPRRDQIASPQAAWLVTNVLADDAARAERFGANSTLRLPDRPAAVKGATTADLRDSWAVGYTPDLVVGVWVGNADGTPMDRAFGLDGAVAIWHEVMEGSLKGQPAHDFAPPDGLVQATVGGMTDWFIAGTVPPAPAATPTPASTPIAPAPGSPPNLAPAPVRSAPEPAAAHPAPAPSHGKHKGRG